MTSMCIFTVSRRLSHMRNVRRDRGAFLWYNLLMCYSFTMTPVCAFILDERFSDRCIVRDNYSYMRMLPTYGMTFRC